jgi:uncharacterized protein YndB with AHSA1/START domain
MGRATATVEIARSAEQVFDFLSDLENDAKWAKNWHSKRIGEAREAGASYQRWYHNPFGKPMEATVTVTGYQRPLRFDFESRNSSGRTLVSFVLEPIAGGVRVTKHEDMQHGGLFGLVATVFALGFRIEARKLMQCLKQVCEEEPSPPSPGTR